MGVTLIGSATGCAQWGWNDSGNLSIAQPPGIEPGDLIMALLGNHADGDVGAGFVEGPGMPSMSRLFLHSSPGGSPGTNGGTLDWRYWTFLGTEPDPFNWTCDAILDLGVVLAFRTDGDAITPDTYTVADNLDSDTSATSPITCRPNRFLVGCWYTQSGGINVDLDFTPDPALVSVINAVDPGTLRQMELVQIQNAPVSGTFSATVTMQQPVDTCAYMTSWVGTLQPTNPCFPPPLRIVSASANTYAHKRIGVTSLRAS